MIKAKFFNRELSWIEFNYRVLCEGLKKELPLLERLNFLAITESNFDEFFQVRVASIMRDLKKNPRKTDSSGLLPEKVLEKISIRCHQITKIADDVLNSEILPELSEENLTYVKPEFYSAEQKSFAESLFKNQIFPLLTPLRTDGSNKVHIGNLKMTAAFLLEEHKNLSTSENLLSTKEKDILALVEIPSILNRVVYLPSSTNSNKKEFAVVEDIICAYGSYLFPGYKIKESLVFKIARDADFAVDEENTANFIQAMEEVLEKRQSSFAVRMLCSNTSEKIKNLIQTKLNLKDNQVYEINSLMNLNSLMELSKNSGTEKLLYPEWKNFYPATLPKDQSFWNSIRQHDILLNVPYESYEPVLKFIKDAAWDEHVLAIKMTLYRTGNDSPIVKFLKEAAQNGKQVTVFVELKARFDEKRNISWAEELEKAGVIVVYGVVNLKVHAKILLIVRKEADGIRRYAHLSTGNYNPKTAKSYADLSVFTSNPEIVNDATIFFNVISGYSALQTMHQLYMAPVTLKSRLIELIDREIKRSTSEMPGHIVAKMNSLCHPEIIKKLYEASCAGVKIELNVRGICTLVPGIKNLSENITVVSVIDRYLEHSRIFYFQNAEDEELYLSSADWMERNLDRRIELMFPITDKFVFKTIKDNLRLYFEDNTHSYNLQKTGKWKQNIPAKKQQIVRVQEILYKKYKKKNEVQQTLSPQEFIVRRNG